MFHNATLRLTALYVATLTAICLFFSVNLYLVSTRELDVGLGRQLTFLQRAPRFHEFIGDDIVLQRQTQLEEAKHRVVFGLVYVDLIIIGLGGVGCYLLARRTLRPIQVAHDAQVRFTADASHELRTPLAVMQSEIEVTLREKNMTIEGARKLMRSNLEELSKLTTLSEGLLKLARNGERLDMKKNSLGAIIAQAINRVKELAAKKGISIDNQTINHSVYGDEASLVQLFAILLENAIKYSHEGTSVTISSGHEMGHSIINVRDQGIGINKDALPYIFDRFYRANEGRSKEKVSGYGLGLAIAKKIVEAHRGTIEAHSTGNGSEFTVGLNVL